MSTKRQQSGHSWWDEEQELRRKMREADATSHAEMPGVEVPVHDLSREAGAYEAMSDETIRGLIAQAEAGMQKYDRLHRRLDEELRRRRGEDVPASHLPEDEVGPSDLDRAA